MNDEHLISQCLNGNPEAFGVLMNKYKKNAYSFAYTKLGNSQDAEDVTQEAFTVAYQKLHTLREGDKFLAWLYKITSNLCKKHIQSRQKRPDSIYVEDIEPETLNHPSINSYQEGMARESLYQSLASLSETYCQALTLYYLHGMSCKEIADLLGTSPHAIEIRLSRARAKLKDVLVPQRVKKVKEEIHMKKLDTLRQRAKWVTHLGCIQGCLEHLNINVSDAWLFGATGYAFIINISEGIRGNGPFNWITVPLVELAENIGYKISGVAPAKAKDSDFAEKRKQMWDYTREAIDKGLPCYGYWVGPVGEFYVVYGYDETGYYYSGVATNQFLFHIDTKFEDELVRDKVSDELRRTFENNGISLSPDGVWVEQKAYYWHIRDPHTHREFGVNYGNEYKGKLNVVEEDVGGPKPWQEYGDKGFLEMYYVEPGQPADDVITVKAALEMALEHAKGKWAYPRFKAGLEGFELWLDSLAKNKADGLGTSFNAAVWAECREHGAKFLAEARDRIAKERANGLRTLFDEAINHYEVVAKHLQQLVRIFPFPTKGWDVPEINNPNRRRAAVAHLRAARNAEEAGLKTLKKLAHEL